MREADVIGVLVICDYLASLGAGALVSVKAMSKDTGVPYHYAEQLCLKLRRAGVLQSRLGVLGGYRLARPAFEIDFYEPIKAVRKPYVAFPRCAYSDDAPMCARCLLKDHPCRIRPVLRRAHDALVTELRRFPLWPPPNGH